MTSFASKKAKGWQEQQLVLLEPSPYLMSNRLHQSCLPGGILPAVLCAHPFPLRSFQKEEEEEPHPYFSVA